jgi:hypothetical protein
LYKEGKVPPYYRPIILRHRVKGPKRSPVRVEEHCVLYAVIELGVPKLNHFTIFGFILDREMLKK